MNTVRGTEQPEKGAVVPVLTPQIEDAKPESLIDRHSSLKGHYRSTHNLRIQGEVDGEIECQSTLTIDGEAKVRAKVIAQNVTVGGSLEGEVTCPGRFQILPTGRVIGKVVAGKLEILAGGFYQGDLSMHPDANPGKVESFPKRSALLDNPFSLPTALGADSPIELSTRRDGKAV